MLDILKKVMVDNSVAKQGKCNARYFQKCNGRYLKDNAMVIKGNVMLDIFKKSNGRYLKDNTIYYQKKMLDIFKKVISIF